MVSDEARHGKGFKGLLKILVWIIKILSKALFSWNGAFLFLNQYDKIHLMIVFNFNLKVSILPKTT
ncbi:MAG: hypothetical protein K0R18_776 [Bacillales bacterium]|jgi:hypothetical protein|nr:hypothetical protein [Bacillales bacterium]